MKNKDYNGYFNLIFCDQYFYEMEREGNHFFTDNFFFCAKVNSSIDLLSLKQSVIDVLILEDGLFPSMKENDNFLSEKAALSLKFIEIKEISCFEDEKTRDVIKKDFEVALDIENKEFFKIKIYKTLLKEIYFCLSFHHLCMAAHHLPILINKIFCSYSKSKISDQYTFSDLLCNYLNKSSDEINASKEFWNKYLHKKGVNTNQLNDASSSNINTKYITLKKSNVEKLKQLCKKNNVTFFSGMTSVFLTLCKLCSNQKNMIIGIPTSGRSKKIPQEVIGYTVNTIPFISCFEKFKNFDDVLFETGTDIKNVVSHCDYPLMFIMDDFSKNNKDVKNLFKSDITYRRSSLHPSILEFCMGICGLKFDVCGVELESVGLGNLPSGHSSFSLAITEGVDQTYLSLFFDSEIFNLDFVNCFFKNFELLLEFCVESPQDSLSNFSFYLPSKLKSMNQFLFTEKININNEFKESIEWWKKELNDAPPLLNFPVDYLRKAEGGLDGKLYNLKLSEEMKNGLEKLSKQEGVTLFQLCFYAFNILLYRYTYQNDLVVGIPVSGRKHPDVEKMIGCFVNVLPVRTFIDESKSFSEGAAKFSKHLMDIMDHDNIPFNKLVSALEVPRSPSYSPIFQVMFNMLTDMNSEQSFGELLGTRVDVDRGVSHLDLSLTIQENKKGLSLSWEYKTELFRDETIARVSSHFVRILDQIIEFPERQISSIELLDEKEKLQFIENWSTWKQPRSPVKLVIDLFEEQVKLRPDAIALVLENHQITFEELDQRANSVAHKLHKNGVKKGDCVGIGTGRSIEYFIAMFGILKAGAAYVPLDLKSPSARISFILRDTQADWVMVKNETEILFKDQNCRTLSLDSFVEKSESPPIIQRHKNQLAYVVYTSGSTGNPKGVVVSLGAISDRVSAKQDLAPMTHRDCVLHLFSFIFDGAIINYFWPLCFGVKLVIASEDQILDAQELIDLISNYSITIMDMLPSLLQLLLEEDRFKEISTLRVVFTGAEAVPKSLVESFYQILPESILYNTYGPTEATVEASSWRCERNFDSTVTPIGYPFGDAKLYVLDSSLRLVPQGVIGELYIGGESLAEEYLNLPELTSKNFISDPFSSKAKSRMYKSGDLVRYRHDGCLEIFGRADNQIKLRGFRLELGEVESILSKIEGISGVHVCLREVDAKKIYTAYFTLKKESNSIDCNDQKLRSILSTQLPEYAIPEIFVHLERFPTLPNGKLNAKALPNPQLVSSNLETILPKNFTEKTIFNIWKEFFKDIEFGITDSFFDIGGNSLMAVRMLSRIRSILDVKITPRILLSNPTIEHLSKWIDSGKTHKEKVSSLVLLGNVKGEGTPIFCVHPVGGNVLCYRELAEEIGDKHPFYGIQAQGIEGDVNPLECIKEMAEKYLNEIYAIRPKGPYLLAGWSFGGLIAAQMAHNMEQRGDNLEQLILIDSTAQLEKLKNVNASSPEALLQELSQHFNVENQISENSCAYEALAKFIEAGEGKVEIPDEYKFQLVKLAQANYKALSKFTIPQLNKTPVLLIKAENKNTGSYIDSEDLGWKKYVSNFSHTAILGDHWTILQAPRVKQLAGKIRTHIGRAKLKI